MLRVERYSRVVKEWSHQSVRQRYALRPSAVLPSMAAGGATSVRMARKTLNTPAITPTRFTRSRSVIFTARADLTRKMTEILQQDRATGWW